MISSAYICMVSIGFGWLVGWLGFYSISTFIGHSTPNPFYANSSISNNLV